MRLKSLSMKRVTFLLSYYNQADVLRRHVLQWKAYPRALKDQIVFCIIDDGSRAAAKNTIDSLDVTDLDLRLYRVLVDLYCNIAGVRNLGCREADTPWVLILDMDTLVPEKAAQDILAQARKGKRRHAYRFNRAVLDNPSHKLHGKTHPAVCLIRKKDYWHVGGCEEDLVGHYGYTDPCFWIRAGKKIRLQERRDIFLEYLAEGEADIVRDAAHNERICRERMALGNWSTKVVRFPWERLM